MFGPQAICLFICLISLAVAGCAGNSAQQAPAPAGGAPPRPQTVVVNDLVFASNAVNLTDGLDGLAIGLMVIAAGALTVLTYAGGHAQLDRKSVV